MMLKEYDQYLDLIKKNPTLPTVAWIDSEIVADDGFNRWAGEIGSSHVEEYVFIQMGRELPELLLKEDVDEYIDYLMEYEEMTEEAAKQKASEIRWKKAIFLNIDLPDNL